MKISSDSVSAYALMKWSRFVQMPTLSLTDFVDIVSKSGTPKATKVLEVKGRGEYEPAFDFYKPLREHIVNLHSQNMGKEHLTDVLESIHNRTKLDNYPELIAGYKKWWGKKQCLWQTPPRTRYTQGGVEIIVNPELGLEIDGKLHIIKLYFKKDKLTKLRLAVIGWLMAETIKEQPTSACSLGVLDIRHSKLLDLSAADRSLGAVLAAEIAYIRSLWEAS